jgi:hypothetical protein
MGITIRQMLKIIGVFSRAVATINSLHQSVKFKVRVSWPEPAQGAHSAACNSVFGFGRYSVIIP